MFGYKDANYYIAPAVPSRYSPGVDYAPTASIEVKDITPVEKSGFIFQGVTFKSMVTGVIRVRPSYRYEKKDGYIQMINNSLFKRPQDPYDFSVYTKEDVIIEFYLPFITRQ